MVAVALQGEMSKSPEKLKYVLDWRRGRVTFLLFSYMSAVSLGIKCITGAYLHGVSHLDPTMCLGHVKKRGQLSGKQEVK